MRTLLVLGLVLPFSQAGCACLLERVVVRAPNHGVNGFRGDDPLPSRSPVDLCCKAIRVEVGPPPASLSLWVIEPPDHDPDRGAPPRGTVLLLHGWRKDKASMLRMGRVFSGEGYRVVLVDLRGHGRSTGEWMSYGARESRDLSQVLDSLEAQGLAAGPIGVFGISYGAAVAIQLAAKDRRVRAVVSVASFSSLREVIPRYVRICLPVAGWLMTERQIQADLDLAAQDAGFDPDAADPAGAMARTDAPVLLIHGRKDFLIPPHHALALKSAGKENTRLVLLDGYGHNSIFHDAQGSVARESSEWFARWLHSDVQSAAVTARMIPGP